jgi:UDP-N-acetyl-D-mannosaminuronate dehydrogenase
MKKVNIIGLGYIGLPTALMFASRGVNIIGVDYNNELVNSLSNGKFMSKVAKATIGLMIVTMLSKILGFGRELALT